MTPFSARIEQSMSAASASKSREARDIMVQMWFISMVTFWKTSFTSEAVVVSVSVREIVDVLREQPSFLSREWLGWGLTPPQPLIEIAFIAAIVLVENPTQVAQAARRRPNSAVFLWFEFLMDGPDAWNEPGNHLMEAFGFVRTHFVFSFGVAGIDPAVNVN
jgi:hypothetical protein